MQTKMDLTNVLQLIKDCRYLEAKKQYDILVESNGLLNTGYVHETHASDIERMLQREKEISDILLNISIEEGKDKHDGWILASTFLGVTCHYQLSEDGIISVRLEGKMKDLPLFEQAAVIHEVDFFKTWIPFCSDSRTVDKIGYADVIAYIQIWIPPLGRDSVLYAYAADCLKESNKIIISGKSIDAWEGAPLRQRGWFTDRMNVMKFLAIIDVTNATSANTSIIAKIDPRTILHQSIINIVVRNLAGVMLYYFQQKVTQVVKEPQGEHAQRIRANPHFYQEWLLPKLQDFARLRGWEMPHAPYWQKEEAHMHADA